MKSTSEGRGRLQRAVRLALFGTATLAAPAAFSATITVNTTADQTDNANCTLREALLAASTNDTFAGCAAGDDNADTIVFTDDVIGQTISLSQGELPGVVSDSSLTIGADTDSGVTIDANSQSRIFVNQGDLTLNGLTLVNGRTMSGSADAADRSGGAILNAEGGFLTVNGGSMRDNVSDRAGGAIEDASVSDDNDDDDSDDDATDNVHVTLNDVDFSGNSAGANPGNGGVVHVTGFADVVVNGGTFDANQAAEGGALWNNQGTTSVDNATFSNNRTNGTDADQGGGAIYIEAGNVVVTDSRFINNTAGDDDDDMSSASGGAIVANVDTELSVSNSRFSGNQSKRAGGAIEVLGGTSTTLDNVTASDNDAGSNPGNGGFLHVSGDGDVDVVGGVFADNDATEGGAFWNNQGEMSIRGASIVDNDADGADATQGGGAIYAETASDDSDTSGTLTIADTRISGNSASGAAGSGGGILLSPGAVAAITASRIEANTANRAGGGIENAGGDLTLERVTLGGATSDMGNDAGNNPGNGGGLHIGADGTTTIDNTSVGYNTAVEGGGLWNSAPGTLDVMTTTVANNTADRGAGVYQDGETNAGISLSYVTVANNNGSGLGSGGADINAANTLISGNDDSGEDNVMVSADNGNLIGDAGFNGMYRLFGGPTATLPLAAGSAAIDMTDDCGDTDQRGAERPVSMNDDSDSDCDVGAFELAGNPVLDVTTVSLPNVDASDGSAGIATVAALRLANNGSDSVNVGGLSGTIQRDDSQPSGVDFDNADLVVYADSNDNGQYDDSDMQVGSGAVGDDGTTFDVDFQSGSGVAISSGDDETYFLVVDLPGIGEVARNAVKSLTSQPMLAGGALLALFGLISVGGLRRRSQFALVALALALTLTACSDDANIDVDDNNVGNNNGGGNNNDNDDMRDGLEANELRFVVDQLEPTANSPETNLVIGDGLPVFGPIVTIGSLDDPMADGDSDVDGNDSMEDSMN